MTVDSIRNGIVIDHITAGRGMELYRLLGLGKLDCPVALLKNVTSTKMGRKDLIKIDADIPLDTDILGYVDPGVTVITIRDGAVADKRQIALPERITNVIRCRNPRCITSTEQELPHIFRLTNADRREYRCLYCEVRADKTAAAECCIGYCFAQKSEHRLLTAHALADDDQHPDSTPAAHEILLPRY